MRNLRACVILYALLTIITGIIYPTLVTGAAALLFPARAEGSLVRRGGLVVGSSLIAQGFARPEYFRPRPSAGGYATVASGASHLGPGSAALAKAVAERRAAILAENPPEATPEMLLASGSGLDPHVSPETALAQAERVAKARGLDPAGRDRLLALVRGRAEGPEWGVLGMPRVNILELNLAVDAAFGAPPAPVPAIPAEGAR